MAGGGDSEDNPVALNVVAMVDIIFCLCVFFMCSFKFKQMEGKFASWLPRDKGEGAPVQEEPIEIRVALYWDEEKHTVERMFGHRKVPDDAELETILRGAIDDAKRQGKPEKPVIIDGMYKVPWGEVMKIVNMSKSLDHEQIEFAMSEKPITKG